MYMFLQKRYAYAALKLQFSSLDSCVCFEHEKIGCYDAPCQLVAITVLSTLLIPVLLFHKDFSPKDHSFTGS